MSSLSRAVIVNPTVSSTRPVNISDHEPSRMLHRSRRQTRSRRDLTFEQVLGMQSSDITSVTRRMLCDDPPSKENTVASALIASGPTVPLPYPKSREAQRRVLQPLRVVGGDVVRVTPPKTVPYSRAASDPLAHNLHIPAMRPPSPSCSPGHPGHFVGFSSTGPHGLSSYRAIEPAQGVTADKRTSMQTLAKLDGAELPTLSTPTVIIEPTPTPIFDAMRLYPTPPPSGRGVDDQAFESLQVFPVGEFTMSESESFSSLHRPSELLQEETILEIKFRGYTMNASTASPLSFMVRQAEEMHIGLAMPPPRIEVMKEVTTHAIKLERVPTVMCSYSAVVEHTRNAVDLRRRATDSRVRPRPRLGAINESSSASTVVPATPGATLRNNAHLLKPVPQYSGHARSASVCRRKPVPEYNPLRPQSALGISQVGGGLDDALKPCVGTTVWAEDSKPKLKSSKSLLGRLGRKSHKPSVNNLSGHRPHIATPDPVVTNKANNTTLRPRLATDADLPRLRSVRNLLRKLL
ncbi:hypothetical protein BV25DRAFT_1913835 [Artomyces pyxidatus]|uniref:Uncharacterized protein n=1 Tax=Artomyces pyxidatus TaxID=48021 RepID=A0ACB8T8T5_9AGAM|nr:hypothetical protein BV25DRAFT_1913835 [Artomyces pyxidatus]